MMLWFAGVRPAVSPAAFAPAEPAVPVPPAERGAGSPPGAACSADEADVPDEAPPPAHAVRSRQPASRMAQPSAQRRGLTMLVMHVGRHRPVCGSGGDDNDSGTSDNHCRDCSEDG